MQKLITTKPSRIALAFLAIVMFIKEVRQRVVDTWNMVPIGIRHSFIGSFCAIALVSMVLYFSLVEFMTLLMFKVLTILLFPPAIAE